MERAQELLLMRNADMAGFPYYAYRINSVSTEDELEQEDARPTILTAMVDNHSECGAEHLTVVMTTEKHSITIGYVMVYGNTPGGSSINISVNIDNSHVYDYAVTDEFSTESTLEDLPDDISPTALSQLIYSVLPFEKLKPELPSSYHDLRGRLDEELEQLAN